MTLWTVACQAPLSMGFSRQEYWSGKPFPSPGDFPDPGNQTSDNFELASVNCKGKYAAYYTRGREGMEGVNLFHNHSILIFKSTVILATARGLSKLCFYTISYLMHCVTKVICFLYAVGP